MQLFSSCVFALAKVRKHFHTKNSDGYTPLHLAVHGGHQNCLRLLIEHGANVNAKGSTALDETDGPYGSKGCAQILHSSNAVASD